MEQLTSWAVALILCAVAGMILHMIAPKGGTQRALRVMLTVFLLCAILSPFFQGKHLSIPPSLFSIESADDTLERMQTKLDYQLQRQAEASARNFVSDLMQELAVEPGQITVDTDIQKDHRIVLNKITVWIPKEAGGIKQTLQEQIGGQTGCDVEIRVESG